jgi:short-subunit dehydrogenase
MMKQLFTHFIAAVLGAGVLAGGGYYGLSKIHLATDAEPLSPQTTRQRLNELKNQVAIITGTSSGIGRELAIEAHRLGLKLVLADITIEPSTELANEFSKNGAAAIAVKTDLTHSGDRENLINTSIQKFGRIDLLINNAGYLYLAEPQDVSLDDVRHVFELHLFASIDLVRQVLPHMAEQGSGKIVNIASILGHYADISGLGQKGLNSIYTSSKAAVVSWSQVIRHSLQPLNVDVKVISPAGVRTNFWRNSAGPSRAESLAESQANWPLYDSPELIAKETFEGIVSDSFVVFPGKAKEIVKAVRLNQQLQVIK